MELPTIETYDGKFISGSIKIPGPTLTIYRFVDVAFVILSHAEAIEVKSPPFLATVIIFASFPNI
jgi:hypothetical protein